MGGCFCIYEGQGKKSGRGRKQQKLSCDSWCHWQRDRTRGTSWGVQLVQTWAVLLILTPSLSVYSLNADIFGIYAGHMFSSWCLIRSESVVCRDGNWKEFGDSGSDFSSLNVSHFLQFCWWILQWFWGRQNEQYLKTIYFLRSLFSVGWDHYLEEESDLWYLTTVLCFNALSRKMFFFRAAYTVYHEKSLHTRCLQWKTINHAFEHMPSQKEIRNMLMKTYTF